MANGNDGIPEIKDRILYWPTILAVVWFVLSPGGALFNFGLPLLSSGIALMICTVWIFHRAWRRLVSTLILPVSVVLMITLTGGW